MAKKKKKHAKVKKLTDEQYNAYIMAMKDEKPPEIVERAQKSSD